ncbi:MAG TPA: ABC transporter ATP-binding protein [Roseiarcus sp.]|jgi:putative spermidine/putrescine transport system ATP-binding protein
MTFLQLSRVQKTFGGENVVKGFDLSVERGELVTFLGPSGCGKTTTLRMIAGFETPTRGEIRIDGEDVTSLRANRRNIGMVFQSYALFPNMTVAGNVGFGLRVAGKPAGQIKTRTAEMLALVKLPELAARYPYQLSGGQQQRVSLARALAPSPRILLLDEPLSALDARIRVSLRDEIRSLQRKLGITTIFVTHDQEEALSMSDRIVVMNGGAIEQVGTPGEIYNTPRTRFVASFVGTLNLIDGRIVDDLARTFEIDGQRAVAGRRLDGAKQGDVRTLALRPEALRLGAADEGRNTLRGTIEDVAFLGAVVRLRVRLTQTTIVIDTFNDGSGRLPDRGEPIEVNFAHDDLIVLDAA